LSRLSTLSRPALWFVAVLLAAPLSAQQPKPEDVEPVEPSNDWPAQSWTMPEVQVIGATPSSLREEELIGENKQPRWTAVRRFPTTRVYVLPPGEFEVEYWLRDDEHGHGDRTLTHLYELEFGLPWRFQFDFYIEAKHDNEWNFTDETARKYELRWALAEWDKIWGNPTLYYEVVDNQHDTDKREAKLLFGGEAGEGWHWGTNLVYEKEVSGAREGETEITAGLSRTIIDEKFSAGGEFKANRVTEKGSSDIANEIYVGPSVQWRPTKRMHVDFAPLVGVGGDSDMMQLWLIAGWEF
jgi:hypothetical protein